MVVITDEVRARPEKVVLDHFHDEVAQTGMPSCRRFRTRGMRSSLPKRCTTVIGQCAAITTTRVSRSRISATT
jgi:hypothetical protein